MADINDRPTEERRGLLRDLAARVMAEHLVADAPADHDKEMEGVPIAPGWVRFVVFMAILVLSWALIVLIVAGFVVAAGQNALRPKSGRGDLNATWRKRELPELEPLRPQAPRPSDLHPAPAETRVWAGPAAGFGGGARPGRA